MFYKLMPYDIIRNEFINIRPNKVGGIICADNCVVNFKFNVVINVISSTSAACSYLTNTNLDITAAS